MTFVKRPRSTVAMVVLLIFYMAQGLVALGYEEGELGQELKVGWTGLYLLPCLRAVIVCTALSLSYTNENIIKQVPFVAESSQNTY